MHEVAPSCVVLIGAIPPPFGGVSVHVNRLAHRLSASGIECYIISSCNPTGIIDGVEVVHAQSKFAVILQCIKLLPKKPVYHFHTMWNNGICKFLLKLLGQRIVSTMHDAMLHDKHMACSYHRKFLNRVVIKQRSEKYIAVNEKIQTVLEGMGVVTRDISVIPAYLSETRTFADDVPEIVKEYIEKHDSVILVYGWKVSFDKDGSDIYGFDTALRVYAAILKIIPAIGMIVLVPGGDSDEYIENLASALKVQDKYLLHTEPIKNMVNLLSIIAIYFRPSITDGDSILVREALAAGVRVVASNVLQRPEGVVAVDNELQEYLNVLKETSIEGSCGFRIEDNYVSIIDLYRGKIFRKKTNKRGNWKIS